MSQPVDHFITVHDFSRDEIARLFDLTARVKARPATSPPRSPARRWR